MPEKVHVTQAYVPTPSGEWVNEGFKTLARVLQDYDYNLELHVLPSELRHTPFLQENFLLIFDRFRNSAVFYFSPKSEPNKILARVFRADTRKNDVLANLDSEEKAAEMLRLRKEMDDQAERNELAAWAVATQKNYPQFKPPGEDKSILFDNELRRVGKGRR